jgi:hypothetical protein
MPTKVRSMKRWWLTHCPPPATCMECGRDCDISEIVAIDYMESEIELWCYCPVCDVETFHPLIPLGSDDLPENRVGC